MEVWILEQGCYSDRYVEGVYSTPEVAMAKYPVTREARPHYGSAERLGGWKEDGRTWSNGLDWGEALHLYPETVDEGIDLEIGDSSRPLIGSQ